MKGGCEGGAVKGVVLLIGFHEGNAMKSGAMTRSPGRSVSGQYASYWSAFLLKLILILSLVSGHLSKSFNLKS